MSYLRVNPFDITPGTAFEAFRAGTRNPMIPQAHYRPSAAGPRMLAGTDGLGGHKYWSTDRPGPMLQGMGDALQELLAAGQPAINQASGLVLNAMWPSLQAKLDEQLRPIKIFIGVTAVAAVASASFSFLVWQKQMKPLGY